MADHGPFQMEGEEYERLAVEILALLRSSHERAVAQFGDVPNNPLLASVGGSLVGRSTISVLVQGIIGQSGEVGITGFDVVDGLAHGFGAYMAQQDPGAAAAAMQLLMEQTHGYHDRTRAAIQRPEKLHG